MSNATDWLIAFQVVQRFEAKHGEGESRGACHVIATEIQSLIGGKVVSGHIRMRQGDAQHWWVETEDGYIIDPLAVLWMDEPYHHAKIKMETRPF